MLYWVHIVGEDAKTWHLFTSKENVKQHVANKEVARKGYKVREGPVVLPQWTLEVQLLERHGDQREAKKYCEALRAWLIRVAMRLEGSEFWEAGWFVRRASFLLERKKTK